MPVNNFTVGKDVSLVIQTASGPLTVPGLTDFSADPVYTDLKSKPIDGEPIFGYIPDGWKLSFKWDRTSPVVDNYFAQLEDDYFNGGNQLSGTVYETITESDGSLSQWRYTGVVVKLDKAGDFSGDKKVEQSFSGMGSRKVKVS
jgi:hypothetical protein